MASFQMKPPSRVKIRCAFVHLRKRLFSKKSGWQAVAIFRMSDPLKPSSFKDFMAGNAWKCKEMMPLMENYWFRGIGY